MGARPYDPTLGRFLAIDPIDGGSLNNYDYAGQDPINAYDLDGLRVDPGKGPNLVHIVDSRRAAIRWAKQYYNVPKAQQPLVMYERYRASSGQYGGFRVYNFATSDGGTLRVEEQFKGDKFTSEPHFNVEKLTPTGTSAGNRWHIFIKGVGGSRNLTN